MQRGWLASSAPLVATAQACEKRAGEACQPCLRACVATATRERPAPHSASLLLPRAQAKHPAKKAAAHFIALASPLSPHAQAK